MENREIQAPQANKEDLPKEVNNKLAQAMMHYKMGASLAGQLLLKQAITTAENMNTTIPLSIVESVMQGKSPEVKNETQEIKGDKEVKATVEQVKEQLSPFIEIIQSINEILKQIENKLPKEVLGNVA